MKNAFLKTLTAVAAGASAMYFLDRKKGPARRAEVRDRVIAASQAALAASQAAGDMARTQGKQVAERAKDLVAESRWRLGSSFGPVSDGQLRDKLLGRLGHVVEYPKALDVAVDEGRVRLKGHVLARDLDLLLSQISATPGVQGIVNGLKVHSEAGNVPELQGLRKSRSLFKTVAMAAPVAVMLGAAEMRRRKSGATLSSYWSR